MQVNQQICNIQSNTFLFMILLETLLDLGVDAMDKVIKVIVYYLYAPIRINYGSEDNNFEYENVQSMQPSIP